MTESDSKIWQRKTVAKGRAQSNDASAVAEQCNAKAIRAIEGEKVFIERESLLTTLMAESPHVRTVYNIFIAVLFLLLINTLLNDFVHFGKINVGFQRIKVSFWSKESCAVYLWLLQFSTALAAYPGFRLWAVCRRAFAIKPSFASHCINAIGVTGYIALQVVLMGVPIYSLYRAPLPVGSGTAITLEMFRHSMKVHAFVRSCTGRAANPPPASCYIYFLFAPTLIYRDTYLRTKKIRWMKVLYHLMEMGGVIFFLSFIIDTLIIPCWVDFGKEEVFAAEKIVEHILSHMILCAIMFVSVFYCMLHAWHNAAAEVLTFADRLFYEEWWVSSRFSDYYRRWNIPVHEWLHVHIYREVAPRAGRAAGQFAVFTVSAIAHELTAALTLGFFYPVLLISIYVSALVLVPLTSELGHRFPHMCNMLMWLLLFVGHGILWIIYSMEIFARVNCPKTENDSWFIPKSWSCSSIKFKPDWSFKNPFM